MLNKKTADRNLYFSQFLDEIKEKKEKFKKEDKIMKNKGNLQEDTQDEEKINKEFNEGLDNL